MAAPLKTAIPSETPLPDGCTIELAAVDPTTGAAITGVTVSNVSIYVEATGSATLEGGRFTLVDPKLLHKA